MTRKPARRKRSDMEDSDDYADCGETECCQECMGTGMVVTCCDDLCVGAGHCMHGDGNSICEECGGEGFYRAGRRAGRGEK